MPIVKTLSKATKLEKEKFTIPKSVQDAIPIQRIWSDGIFQIGSRFSKTFSFTDINYSIAGKEDKTAMFLDYSEFLNALDSGASAKITINNRRINKAEFESSLLLPMKEDGLDHFRKEYNEMLLSKVSGTNNSVVQDRYITVTVAKRNIDEARTYFSRGHRPHHASFPALLHLPGAGRRNPFTGVSGFFQGGRASRFSFQSKRADEKRTQLQGLAVPGFYGISKGPLPSERPLGAGALPAGICQLHQGFHDRRALRHGPQPHAFH